MTMLEQRYMETICSQIPEIKDLLADLAGSERKRNALLEDILTEMNREKRCTMPGAVTDTDPLYSKKEEDHYEI